MKTTSTKQTQCSKVPSELFNDLPFLTRARLQKLWDNACGGETLHRIYIKENDIDMSDSNNVSWNALIGIKNQSQISDYTNTEILSISNKAKKLAYKNDSMSTFKLRKIWLDTIHLEKVFVSKQGCLSGKKYITMGIKWQDMIGMHKNFNYCSEKEILGMYEKAVWYCNNADRMSRYECECCGCSYFFIEENDENCNGDNEKDYLKTMWVKNKCHILSGEKEIGYGSLLSGDIAEIQICDDCLYHMKNDSVRK